MEMQEIMKHDTRINKNDKEETGERKQLIKEIYQEITEESW